jgi:hypothetical protein
MSSRPTELRRAPGPFRKPRPDLYTMMLLVAFLALVIGTVFLYLEWQRLESRAQGPAGGTGILPVIAAGTGETPVPPNGDFRSLQDFGSLIA